ncbi:MAG: MG2 domain-containing protein [Saprospiraceae bacterium]|nr:MG2 domain-containing protein [Saprospiraceae bacterium]
MFRHSPSILRTIFQLLFLSAIIASCEKPVAPSAYSMPENLHQYVLAYTSGYISRASPIQIQFVEAQVAPSDIGAEAEAGLLRFSPKIAGKLTWETTHTLRFEPDELLASGKTYTATLLLEKILPNVPEDLRQVSFHFQSKEQFYDIRIDALDSPDPNDRAKQVIRGQVSTYDVASLADMEQVVTASQDNKNLTINWQEGANGQQFFFSILDIQRTRKASAVDIRWDGAALKVNKKGSRSIEIASLDDFKVLDVQYIPGADAHLLLQFSDPISSDQNLDGLLQIPEYAGKFRSVISGHQIRVYPDRPIRGSKKIGIFQGIQNYAGNPLPNPVYWEIVFDEPQPQVQLLGSGTILPESDGLILPFEAIGLKSVVVEVFKIYHNNILQFLQTNTLDGEYELYRVGKIIRRKTIALGSTASEGADWEWKRHSLDLTPLIDQDPSAIYQVRIGFMPEDALYFCEAEMPATPLSLRQTEASELNDNSIMDLYYGSLGYSDGYSWEDREDPCKPAYYHSGRFVSKNIFASNLGITVKSGTEKSWFAAVTDLRTVAPLQGVNLDFYDYQLQRIHTSTTGKDGTVLTKIEQMPYFVVATQGRQKGYLRLEDGESLSLSKFDVAGTYSQEGLKGYLYGERGVWRPGDSVFLNFVLDDKNGLLPDNYPVSMEVRDARGQIHYKKNAVTGQLNVYPFHFATPQDAPTGRWLARVSAGSATFEKVLSIENVKPNRLKIDMQVDANTLSPNKIQGKLSARWLQGGAARQLKAKVAYRLSATRTTFPKYPDFVFDDPASTLSTETQTAFDGQLNDAGTADFSFGIGALQHAPGRLRLAVKTTVFETSGNFSTDNQVITYDPFTSYSGVSIPTNEYGVKNFDTNKDFFVTLAATDNKGKGISGKTLEVDIYAVNWRWWWDQSENDETNSFISGINSEIVTSSSWVTENEGKKRIPVNVNTSGRYFIRVCDPVNGHCTGDYFYAGSPWDTAAEDREAAVQLPITTDKDSYQPGEEVTLSIQGSQGGKALISIENGSRILSHFWQDLKEGKNDIRFVTTPDMAPNVYAHVALMQGHGQLHNDLPLRLYGVVPLEVSDPATRLQPVMQLPKEVKPNSTFTLEISEQNKQTMAYTVAVVDEGLLGLTRFQTPDPHASLFAREALGVKTWDIYDDVLGGYGARLERLISIGGDGNEVTGAMPDNANRFKPVVRHLGPFLLKKGQKASHKIALPNYVGEVRVMVIAAKEGAYGNAEASVSVKQPLMVLPTLPRVLRPGEQFELPVNIFAMDPAIKQVTANLQASGGLLQIENASSNLTFSQPGEQMAYFKVRVGEKTGITQISTSVKGGGYEASETVEIAIIQPNVRATASQAGVLQTKGAAWAGTVDPVGIRGTNSAVLEVSTLPPLNLSKHLDYLLGYPYGCVEQTVSAAFPQLFLDRLLPMDAGRKKQTNENIFAAIDRLKLFQTTQGGFGYWPGAEVADPWGSTYAGHFLLEAKNKGYAVPEHLLNPWIRFQRELARSWTPNPAAAPRYDKANYQLEQAYRLFTLALAGQPELAAMNLMRQSPALAIQAKWRLAAAYALVGQTEAAAQLVEQLSTEVAEYREMGYTYGSRLRDRAMILETLVLLGALTATQPILEYISGQLSGGGYLNTQEIGYALLAVAKFAGDSDALSEGFTFTATLGTQKTDAGSEGPVFQLMVPDPEKTGTVQVVNTSEKVLFARLLQSGIPAAGQEKPSSNGIRLEVDYRDAAGQAVKPEKLSQGTEFMARITVSNPGSTGTDYENLALTHVFPSGWEILNDRLDATGGMSNGSVPDYTDIKDDRVHLFFGLPSGTSKTFIIRLNAAYRGRYYLPSVTCTAMYDPGRTASTAGQWIEVVAPASN